MFKMMVGAAALFASASALPEQQPAKVLAAAVKAAETPAASTGPSVAELQAEVEDLKKAVKVLQDEKAAVSAASVVMPEAGKEFHQRDLNLMAVY